MFHSNAIPRDCTVAECAAQQPTSSAGAVFVGSVAGMLTMGCAAALLMPLEEVRLAAGTWVMYWESDQRWLTTRKLQLF